MLLVLELTFLINPVSLNFWQYFQLNSDNGANPPLSRSLLDQSENPVCGIKLDHPCLIDVCKTLPCQEHYFLFSQGKTLGNFSYDLLHVWLTQQENLGQKEEFFLYFNNYYLAYFLGSLTSGKRFNFGCIDTKKDRCKKNLKINCKMILIAPQNIVNEIESNQRPNLFR